jgi:hypothetical protein
MGVRSVNRPAGIDQLSGRAVRVRTIFELACSGRPPAELGAFITQSVANRTRWTPPGEAKAPKVACHHSYWVSRTHISALLLDLGRCSVLHNEAVDPTCASTVNTCYERNIQRERCQ